MKKLFKSLALVTGLSIAGFGIGCGGDDKKKEEIEAFGETVAGANGDTLILTPSTPQAAVVTVTVTAEVGVAGINYSYREATPNFTTVDESAGYSRQSSSVATLVGGARLGTIQFTATSTEVNAAGNVTEIEGTYTRQLSTGVSSTGTFVLTSP